MPPRRACGTPLPHLCAPRMGPARAGAPHRAADLDEQLFSVLAGHCDQQTRRALSLVCCAAAAGVYAHPHRLNVFPDELPQVAAALRRGRLRATRWLCILHRRATEAAQASNGGSGAAAAGGAAGGEAQPAELAEVFSLLPRLPRLEVLALVQTGAGAGGMAALAAAAPVLQRVVMEGEGVGDAGARALAALPPRALDLLSTPAAGIGPAGAGAIARALTALTWLNLSGNALHNTGAMAIARLRTLRDLRVNDCSIHARGARALAKLTGLTRLEALRMDMYSGEHVPRGEEGRSGGAGSRGGAVGGGEARSGSGHCGGGGDDGGGGGGEGGGACDSDTCSITTEDEEHEQIDCIVQLAPLANLEALSASQGEGDQYTCEALRTMTRLRELTLCDQLLSSCGAMVPIARMASITSLDVTECWLREDDARDLVALTSLRELCIGANELGDGGVGVLARGLTNLRCLVAYAVGLTAAGVRELSHLTALETLTVAANDVTDAGANALAAGFARMPSLTFINMCNCGLTAAAVPTLAALTQLTELQLSANNIGDAGVATLAGGLRGGGLLELHVLDCGLGAAGVEALCQLAALTKLEVTVSGAQVPDAMPALRELCERCEVVIKVAD